MISVDTSVVVRYLVGTPEVQAARAAKLIDDAEMEVGVIVVALVETAHVLRTQYGVDRAVVLETLIDLLTRSNIELLGLPKAAALSALVRARSLPRSPLPDAWIAATSEWARALPLYTFDEVLPHGVAVVHLTSGDQGNV